MRLDSIEFGSISIDGVKRGDVILVAGQVVERDRAQLKVLFGTSHKIGDWEIELLCSKSPQVILVGNGFQGVLEVDERLRSAARKAGARLEVVLSPAAIERYAQLVAEGKRVNALIHTTC